MHDPHADGAMSEIVHTVARLVLVPILVYGAYVVLYGHLTPGGGFAGGVAMACGFVALGVAGGPAWALRLFGRGRASLLEAGGIASFLLLAALGAWFGEAFFANFIDTPAQDRFSLMSGGIVPLANVALGLKVVSSLFLVFVALAVLKRLANEGEGETDDGAQR